MKGRIDDGAPQLSYRGLLPSNSHSLLPNIQSRNQSQPQILSTRQVSIPNLKLFPSEMSRKDRHHIDILKTEFKKKKIPLKLGPLLDPSEKVANHSQAQAQPTGALPYDPAYS